MLIPVTEFLNPMIDKCAHWCRDLLKIIPNFTWIQNADNIPKRIARLEPILTRRGLAMETFAFSGRGH
jgi:hypothetical protein